MKAFFTFFITLSSTTLFAETSQELIGIFKNESDWTRFVRVVEVESTGAKRNALLQERVSGDATVLDSERIFEGRFVTNPIQKEDGKYLFASVQAVDSELEARTLRIALYEGSGKYFYKTKEFRIRLGNFLFENENLSSFEKAAEFRKSISKNVRSLYEAPWGLTPPELILGPAEHPILLVDQGIEYHWIDLTDEISHVAKPLARSYEIAPELHWCRNSEGRMIFASSGTREELARMLRMLRIEDFNGDSGIIIFEQEREGGFFAVLQKAEMVKGAFETINDCVYDSQASFLVGKWVSANRSKQNALVIKLPVGREAKFRRVAFDGFSSGERIAFDEFHQPVVAGRYDYYQASSGSVSYSKSFVHTLTRDLEFDGPYSSFASNRSTIPQILKVEEERVWIGGVQNAPSTHDTDRSTDVFLNVINRNHTHPTKEKP